MGRWWMGIMYEFTFFHIFFYFLLIILWHVVEIQYSRLYLLEYLKWRVESTLLFLKKKALYISLQKLCRKKNAIFPSKSIDHTKLNISFFFFILYPSSEARALTGCYTNSRLGRLEIKEETNQPQKRREEIELFIILYAIAIQCNAW